MRIQTKDIIKSLVDKVVEHSPSYENIACDGCTIYTPELEQIIPSSNAICVSGYRWVEHGNINLSRIIEGEGRKSAKVEKVISYTRLITEQKTTFLSFLDSLEVVESERLFGYSWITMRKTL